MNGQGTFEKIQDKHIVDNSISEQKLNGCNLNNDGLKVLHNDGQYKTLSSSGMVYPNEDKLLNGFGAFDKVKDKYIDDNSIDPIKLNLIANNYLFSSLFNKV